MSTPFGPLYASSYDELYREKDYLLECDVVTEAFRRYGAAPVVSILDLGCGTGGHAIELALRGYSVTGVDKSPDMLSRAETKAAAAGVSVAWSCADVRDFQLEKRFESAISMFSVFGYLTANADLLQCFRRVRSHLLPAALFVFEVWFGPAVLAVRPEPYRRREVTVGGVTYERESKAEVDIIAQCCHLEYSLKGPGEEAGVAEHHDVRFFFPQEIALLLETTGFRRRLISRFPSLDDPADETSWNVLVVAEAV
ncbi:MAG TPA: class I SAM-dependent methyltransferase [Thermoanaerobaculia bacterium]